MVDSCYYFLLNGGSNVDISAVDIQLTSISGETITETLSLTADECTEGTSNFGGSTASTVQARSKSRGKTTNAGQTLKDKKPRAKQQKYSVKTSDTKEPTTNSGKLVCSEVKQPGSSPKPMEQVPGEAPTETAVVTKRQQYVKVSAVTEAKQEQKLHREQPAQRNSSTKPSERKSSTGSTRKHEPESKRVVEKVSTTKPRAPASKFKPKQVRQVYVVKTPAPVSSMSTAA
ncbi:hypothetical protein DVH05_004341 [Phytophthora capsici]|nr:hypothetical protein DVH05_004341 [Phytophthora capsici]